MWEMISEEHKKAITSYMSQGPKSLLLIGKDGVRVKVHATLLALHCRPPPDDER